MPAAWPGTRTMRPFGLNLIGIAERTNSWSVEAGSFTKAL
jgi:hypothetical protein